MVATNPMVDDFLESADAWKDEFSKLRAILAQCDLTEEFKWKHPCYTHNGKNIVLIHGFKEYCALLFFKGALMRDPERMLVRQTENVQSARQIRFASTIDIEAREEVIKSYVKEAINIEESGMKVKKKDTGDYEIPEEFQSRLDSDPSLREAFNALTPGRQRAYIFYFSSARRSATRHSRIDKYTGRILEGKGLND